MDIDLLSRIIKELITDHDQVGLLGLGTFVAEVVPASFSDKGYTINPPYRRLSFHPSVSETDLLVDFYAESNHVSAEASRVYISEFLAELKQVLMQRKTVVFPGLGRLRATRENNFFFVPDEDLDIYPDGFGLQPVSMKYLHSGTNEVDIKLSYAEAMQGLVDRQRANEDAGLPSDDTPQNPEVLQSGAAETEGPEERATEAPTESTIAATGESTTESPGESTTELPAAAESEESASAEGEGIILISDVKPEAAPSDAPVIPGSDEPEMMSSDASETAEEETTSSRKYSRWWIAPVVIVSVAAVALGVFIILAHAAPELIDSILYTPEELQILNY